MPTTVLQAAVGAGKTEAALQQLIRHVRDYATSNNPLPKIWVLLATKRQEIAFRQRLIEHSQQENVFFNVEFFNFYELNTRILNVTHQPTRRIHEPARLGLVRTIAEQLNEAGELQIFGNIATTAGFVNIVAAFIYELKQNLIESNNFADAAHTQKDNELARIYSAYQDALIAHKLVDREGEGWLAVKATDKNDADFEKKRALFPPVNLLLVDGYDQFNIVQASLLANLSALIDNVVVTMTTVPDREDTLGRRFAKASAVLEQAHHDIQATIAFQHTPQQIDQRAGGLQNLTRHVFLNKPRTALTDGSIRFIEAPEPEQEVSAVLRQIKRMLLDGVNPDDILIAVRDWGRYGNHLNTYRREYDMPMLLHYSPPISDNPALKVLLDVLQLSDGVYNADTSYRGFRRREVLDILRSPYIAVPNISGEDIELLDQISLRQWVVGGRDAWLDAITDATQAWYDAENDTHYEPLLDVSHAEHLRQALAAWFDHITPIGQAFLHDYVTWLEELIGKETLLADNDTDEMTADSAYSLQMIASIRANSDKNPELTRLMTRDIGALNSLKRIMRGFLHIEELLKVTLNEAPERVTWDDFVSELRLTIENATEPQRNPIRNGRVLATTAADARGLPHAHVFILGLSEGIFPSPVPEDPLYLDSERTAFNRRGIALETQAERANDDGLFYELISLPYQSLTLSRPTIREGKIWNESHLWRMVRAVFTADSLSATTQRIRIGEVVAVEDVASLNEALLAVADALNQKKLAPTALQVWRWLRGHEDTAYLWSQIAHGRAIETSRMSSQPHDAYSGQLHDPVLIEFVRDQLHDDRKFSATQLNDFGKCGYLWFAKRLLKLELLEEPQEGLDARQLGTLYHAVLEGTYQQILDKHLVIHADNAPMAVEILDAVMTQHFESVAQRVQFRAGALWGEERRTLEHRLRALVQLDFSDDSPIQIAEGERVPYALELSFGANDSPFIRIPLDNPTLPTIAVRGSIDRVDRVDDKFYIVDYKSGSAPISVGEMKKGRNFQMMVYVLALNEMLQQRGEPYEIVGGLFWSVRKRTKLGGFSASEDGDALKLAQEAVVRYVEAGRVGDFAVHASQMKDSKCSDYCEFYQLCRLSNTYPFKKQ